MTQADKDVNESLNIAVVEITVEGGVVYSKAVFCDPIDELKDDIDGVLYYYDEAK